MKSVLKRCSILRRFKTRSEDQFRAHLPLHEIGEQKKFVVIGLDFVRMVYVRSSENKHYASLCVYAITRAVHFELVLKKETSLQAIFKELLLIVVNNAKRFFCAKKWIINIWKIISHPEAKNYFNSKRIKWKFII